MNLQSLHNRSINIILLLYSNTSIFGTILYLLKQKQLVFHLDKVSVLKQILHQPVCLALIHTLIILAKLWLPHKRIEVSEAHPMLLRTSSFQGKTAVS
jgi:hypothetical protein